MAGDVIWMTVIMWVVATIAFAPLGYFIREYAKKDKARAEG